MPHSMIHLVQSTCSTPEGKLVSCFECMKISRMLELELEPKWLRPGAVIAKHPKSGPERITWMSRPASREALFWNNGLAPSCAQLSKVQQCDKGGFLFEQNPPFIALWHVLMRDSPFWSPPVVGGDLSHLPLSPGVWLRFGGSFRYAQTG